METLSVDAGTLPRRSGKGRVLLGSAVAACLLGAVYFVAAPSVVGCASCQVDMQEVAVVLGALEEAANEYAQSPQAVQHMLAESPRVREMAKESPQIKKLLEDPKQIGQMVKYLREMHATLRQMHQEMESREGLKKMTAQVQGLVQDVRGVLADPEVREMFAAMEHQKAVPRQLAAAFAPAQVPRMRGAPAARAASPKMFTEGDIGVTPPLGVYDPLGLIETKDMRRFEEMEIKHGRLAMAATTHALVTSAGLRFPGYLSDGTFGGEPVLFADVPGGTLASLTAVPGLGWAQIIAFIGLCESSVLLPTLTEQFGLGPIGLFKQDPDREPGDTAPEWGPWVRYDDPDQRAFKLNVERNNGRAAMLGIIGMMSHEALGQPPFFPLGWFGVGIPGVSDDPDISVLR
jgi:hypothetical protein